MALSALDDPSVQPTENGVASVLGSAIGAWKALIDWLGESAGVDRLEWHSSGAKYGWALRGIKGKRTIVYLIPQYSAFLVGLVLGDQAMKAVGQSNLSATTAGTIAAAKKYGEGTGFRLPVRNAGDLHDIQRLIRIKLEN